MMTTTNSQLGYIGTYTKGDSKGIYSFFLNHAEGRITDIKAVAALENPTYLTLSHDKKNLYSVAKDGQSGGLVSYSIRENGDLAPINRQLSEGSSPCHVSIDRQTAICFQCKLP